MRDVTFVVECIYLIFTHISGDEGYALGGTRNPGDAACNLYAACIHFIFSHNSGNEGCDLGAFTHNPGEDIVGDSCPRLFVPCYTSEVSRTPFTPFLCLRLNAVYIVIIGI